MFFRAVTLPILGGLFVAAITGCKATVHDINGRNAVITPEVAVIRSMGNQSHVTSINGRKVAAQWNRRFVVPPGVVTVHIINPSNGGPAAGGGVSISISLPAHDMTFKAQAGHEYEVGYPTFYFGRKPYVEDTTWKKKLFDYSIDGKPANPGAVDLPPPAK